MKRIIITYIILTLCIISSYAQGTSMAIKGCPIKDDTKSFVERMKQLEYTLDEERVPQNVKGKYSMYALNEIPVSLKGKLLNRNVVLQVYGSKLSATVYQVDAVFHPGQTCSSWKTLLETYKFVTEQFMIKYGNPASKKELLITKAVPDKEIIDSFAKDGTHSVWEAIFNAEDGIIKVHIQYNGGNNWASYGSVVVSYISKDGTTLHEKELKDAYQSEI